MLSLSKKVLILVTVPVLFEVGLVNWISSLVARVEDARARAAQARELESSLNAAMLLTMRRVSHTLVRKLATADDTGKSAGEVECGKQLSSSFDTLKVNLTTAEDKQKWRQFTDLISQIDSEWNEEADAYGAHDTKQAAILALSLQRKLDRLFKLTASMAHSQDLEQEKGHSDYVEYDSQLRNLLHLSVLASSFLAFSLALFFNQSTTNRLNKLMNNTTMLAAGKAPVEVVTGRDELSTIDRIYHQMYTDLSVMRQKERAILDNTSEIICSLSKDLKIENINSAAESLWGYRSDELLGLRVQGLLAPQDITILQKELSEALSPAGRRFEIAVRRKDGTASETSWSATWSAGEETYYCVISDISERKQLDKLKQDFVAMISHDLRTPLNSTLASLELVSSPHFDLSSEAAKEIVKAEKNLKLTLSLINQLLEIERMEAGIISLEYDAVSTRELINKALNSVSALAEAKKITITTPNSNHELVADGDRLVQVLINLLGNAIKFSPEGSKIRIREESRGERIRINVIDQGRGIPIEQLASVFERFAQVRPGDAAERAGSGLGLAICKAIVEAHHGVIGVTSEVGIGSTFWFEIPSERS